MKRLPAIFMTMLGLVTLGFVTCEKEVEKIVEAPPAIQVTSIWASDTTVTQGLTVQLSATIETEEGVDASALKYSWFSEKGHLEVSSGDTAVWVAPEEDGVAKVSVHVTDGENIAIGNKNIGVNVYTPAADVYYIGAEQCMQCHGETHTEWSETGHAEAWAALQSSGHPAPYCEPCHSVQQDPTEGNSGYDEVPTMKFEDVQCESCHGPGSSHAG
ncbi:MAG TPA: multiheme c-type cytochrome, partial [bacterium]|nr:multiheme c-type cytochrome [bacterium]